MEIAVSVARELTKRKLAIVCRGARGEPVTLNKDSCSEERLNWGDALREMARRPRGNICEPPTAPCTLVERDVAPGKGVVPDHLGKLGISASGQTVSVIVRLIYILFALLRGRLNRLYDPIGREASFSDRAGSENAIDRYAARLLAAG